jgi:hypothetical protein
MENKVARNGIDSKTPSAPMDSELIAIFGEAQLLRVDGHVQLQGGTMADRIEALEWLSIFLPNEPVREGARRKK